MRKKKIESTTKWRAAIFLDQKRAVLKESSRGLAQNVTSVGTPARLKECRMAQCQKKKRERALNASRVTWTSQCFCDKKCINYPVVVFSMCFKVTQSRDCDLARVLPPRQCSCQVLHKKSQQQPRSMYSSFRGQVGDLETNRNNKTISGLQDAAPDQAARNRLNDYSRWVHVHHQILNRNNSSNGPVASWILFLN